MEEQKSFENLSIDEVMCLVSSGQVTPEEAIEIEAQGKNRKTLIGALGKLIGDDNEKTEEQKPETNKVNLLQNIKYKGERYQIGEEIEIDPKDRESFIKAGIIAGE